MTTQILFNLTLFFATLTTLLVAGLLFTFALIVMPGLGRLDDRGFLIGFQQMDRIIQRSHPIFVTVWLGSILSLPIAIALGFGSVGGLAHGLLITVTVLYFAGVQLPTFRGNVPLNNKLQTLELEAMSEPEFANVRKAFEPEWNRLNMFRTIICLCVAALLIAVTFLR